MRTEIVVHAGAGEPARRIVDGPTTLGGSQADGISLTGLPPAALRLEPRAAGLVVEAATTGLRVGGRLVAPGARRLLCPGERATLRNICLELPRAAPEASTRVAAAALLRGAVEGRAAPSGPALTIVTGPDAGERIALGEGLIVGRGRGASLRLRDLAASRRHARVRLGSAGAVVEDLGSKNPLRVNGLAVEGGATPLRPGDLVTIGETELVFENGPAAPAPAHGGRRGPGRRGARSARGAARRSSAHPLVAAALLALSAAALAAVASCGG